MTHDVDYSAEVRRTRLAQGLDPEIPRDLRDAVAALIAGDPTSPAPLSHPGNARTTTQH